MPLAAGLTISVHMETCVACRAQVCEHEEVEGRELEQIDPTPMRADALATVLARLAQASPTDVKHHASPASLGEVVLPASLARIAFKSRRHMAPGLWAAQARVPTLEGWRTFLLRAPGGMTIPNHRHEGGELISVLRGAFQDGRTYGAGDFAEKGATDEHELRVSPGGPCVCLIAVQGHVRWRGWAKIITPVLGL
jgi:putative transcriptional regulator